MSGADPITASVLLVDDNASSLVALHALLAPLGQRLVTATSGEEALKILLHDEFAVVLMDVRLPGIDGYETASLMRRVQRTRMTPIIFLTGVFREPGEVMKGYDKGAVDYLIKPYDPDILRSKVTVFVELYRTREQLRRMMREEAERTVAEAERAVAEADRARLVEKANDSRLFETVLTEMPLGVLVVNPSGEALLSNRRLNEILGPSTVPAESRRPDGTVLAVEEHPIARTLKSGERVVDEIVLHQRGPNTVRLSLSAAPVVNETGALLAVVGTFVDITQRHAAEREREHLITALEQANEALDRFAYMASHDLKAPLRGLGTLSGWIEESLGDAANPEARKYLGLMRTRVAQMGALIDGILQYTRAGHANAREDVDVGALLVEIVEMLQPGPAALIDVAPGLPVVHIERVPLQQVLMNLIGNALKYAHREDVVVKVGGAREHQNDQTHLHLTVADNGPGIEPEVQSKIWELFQTLESRDKGAGTGIGLSVVKKIVESRGGKVWLESQVGHGCTFHVSWPC